MNKEIERKWIIDEVAVSFWEAYHWRESEASNNTRGETFIMSQGYLSFPPDELRIRMMFKVPRFDDTWEDEDEEAQFFLERKKGAGLVRGERRTLITRDQYLRLEEKVKGTKIAKYRHCVPIGGHQYELDVYWSLSRDRLGLPDVPGDNRLKIMEIEFSDNASAKRFVAPTWFGKEVTHDANYKNGALAQLG